MTLDNEAESISDVVDTNFVIGCSSCDEQNGSIAIFDLDRQISHYKGKESQRLGEHVWMSKDAQPGLQD